MKILSPRVHGILDYLVAIAFALAPTLLGFSGTPATVSYVIAVTHALVTIVTAFPLGLFPLISFPMHGVIETLAAASAISFPWVFRFADVVVARNFFVGAFVAVLVVVLLTDYQGTRTGSRR